MTLRAMDDNSRGVGGRGPMPPTQDWVDPQYPMQWAFWWGLGTLLTRLMNGAAGR